MARVDFFVESWREIGYGKGTLVWLLQPKFFIKGNFEKALPE